MHLRRSILSNNKQNVELQCLHFLHWIELRAIEICTAPHFMLWLKVFNQTELSYKLSTKPSGSIHSFKSGN